MVFHMLRRFIGDKAFWEGLRRIYREKLFQPASWSDFQSIFEQTAGIDLQRFFDQWVTREGAPMILMDEVTVKPEADSWWVRGRLSQGRPSYLLRLGIVLETRTGAIQESLDLSGNEKRFEIFSSSPPKRLSVDPGCDVFRRLYPPEIPPTVNSIKGSDALLVLMANDSSSEMDAAMKTLLRSLGVKDYRILPEKKASDKELAGKDVLIVGYPERRELLPTLPTALALEEDRFRLDSQTYDQAGDLFFGVFDHPLEEGRVTAVFLPLSPHIARTAARKITHYGTYSYLAFRQGRNLQKGVWPVTESPLIHTWKPEH
jgi:hypothetical protein